MHRFSKCDSTITDTLLMLCYTYNELLAGQHKPEPTPPINQFNYNQALLELPATR
jgi:hypothetical protein